MNPESKPLNRELDPRRLADELNAAIAELAKVKAMIAEHNRVCSASCRSRYVHDYCAYRSRDGSFLYGNKRCTDCPEHWIIEDDV